MSFKHIKFNIKAQYPFPGKQTCVCSASVRQRNSTHDSCVCGRGGRCRFTFLCAGTGITPIYQALGKLLGTPGDERKAVVLYGSKSPDDMLLKACATLLECPRHMI